MKRPPRPASHGPALLLLTALAGCAYASQPPPNQFYAGIKLEKPETAACLTGLPPFGISLSLGYYPPMGTMAVRNTGTPCALAVNFAYGTPWKIAVVTPPQHGTLQTDKIREGMQMTYLPAPAYAGADRFSVDANVGGRHWTIPVDVTVTR